MPIAVGIASFIFFILFQARGIYGGDSGDLVTAATTFGVAHPPGYPLFMILGGLFSRIPLFTPAWRVALLSSIPHAITVGFVYVLIYRLTKKHGAAVIGSAVLATNYLFFLYSVTPEVFAMLDLSIVIFVYLAVRLYEKNTSAIVVLGVFLFGLSLTHHHMILFFVPALVYAIWQFHLVPRIIHGWGRFVRVFFVGLTPYIYVPLAAHFGHSMINWDRAENFANFIRLVLRRDYGTFLSGGLYGTLPYQRVLQLRAYGQYIFMDFGIPGVLLMILGAWMMWKNYRKLGVFLFIGLLFLGPVFFFYASFPLMNRFTLGTYERFLLPSYVICALFIGSGVTFVVDGLTILVKHTVLRTIAVSSVIALLLLYPIHQGANIISRFWGLWSDTTAERLARDVFINVPKDSMVIVFRDTILFTTQYVRYARGYRADTIVLHGSMLGLPQYRKTMSLLFPGVVLPRVPENRFVEEFLVENARKRPLYASEKIAIPKGWYWVPHGLLFALVQEKDLPTVSRLKEQNDEIWKIAGDPTQGILGRYHHLMLSDVLDIYTDKRLELGKTYLKGGDVKDAKAEFDHAVRLGGDNQLSDAYVYQGIAASMMKNCDLAFSSFDAAKTHALGSTIPILEYEAITWRDCVGDGDRAKTLFDDYQRAKQKEETPLN